MRSVLSVLSWVVAAWVTWKYSALALPLFDTFELGETMATIVANLAVFFTVLLVATIISALVSKLISFDSFARLDSTLGLAFGLIRGAVVVLLIAVVGSFAFVLEEPWWRDSITLVLIEPYVFDFRDMLSEYVALDAAMTEL